MTKYMPRSHLKVYAYTLLVTYMESVLMQYKEPMSFVCILAINCICAKVDITKEI